LLDVLTTVAVLASAAFAAGVMNVLPVGIGALTVISGADIKTGLATTAGGSNIGGSDVGASTAGLVVDSVGLAATGTGAGVFCC
jgi:hypothetical protein